MTCAERSGCVLITCLDMHCTTLSAPTRVLCHCQDLRARLEVAEKRLRIVESRLNEWRVAARQVLNVLALGPRSNEKYKREVADNLNRILSKLEQVQQVHYINCSFPAIEAQAPDFEMLSWDSLSSSSWFVRWSPSWSVEVSLGYVALARCCSVRRKAQKTLMCNLFQPMRT
jgi:hypothetical protein